jgi:hypothetical protein
MTISGSNQSVTLVGSLTANTNASTITTGTVPTARLATGTANSSTYLRGDQTWAAVPAATPGGSTTQVQFNNAGAFGGSSTFVFNGTNVGIGTGSPGAETRLTIRGTGTTSSTAGLEVANSSGNTRFYVRDDGTTSFYGTSFAETMRVTGDGTVGINTTNPTAQLQINRSGTGDYTTIRLSNSGASGRIYELGVGGNTADSTYANNFYIYDGTAGLNRMAITSTGDFRFNSGYGSAATAYGCRAWVNFNGTGTVAIRASGNVTSITDNGTGDYTINLTTAMPDANYAFTVGQQYTTSTGATDIGPLQAQGSGAQSTTSLRVALKSPSGLYDALIACVAIFR